MTGYFYKNVKNLNKFVKVRGYMVLEVAEVNNGQGMLIVKAELFGQETRLEMKVEDVIKVG